MSQLALTVEEKAQLLDVLSGLDPTHQSIPPEQRRSRRRGVLEWMPVQLMPRFDGDKMRLLRVLIKDVSAGGAGIYARRPFASGDRFVLPIRFREGGGKLFLSQVVFSRPASPRHHAIGAKFIAAIDDPDATVAVPREWLQGRVYDS